MYFLKKATERLISHGTSMMKGDKCLKKKKLPEEENSSSTLVGDHKVKVSTH